MPDDLGGLTVFSFESRRAAEMAELIRRHGGTPVVAPAMREVPLQESPAALEFFRRLENEEIDMVVLLTGVGTRALTTALAERCSADRFATLLRRVCIVARGPKPVAALRELGLTAEITVPEPNTWRDILATLDAQRPVSGLRIAVQEYGAANPELIAGLGRRGAAVFCVPVYRWALPEDTGPLRNAVADLADGRADIVMFTSATQVDHFIQIADELHLRSAVLAALPRLVVASIGPVCSEALHRHRLPVDLEPEHPRMGHLVSTVARCGRELLALKNRRGDTETR